MKFCPVHYAALRQAIADRGLWSLVGNQDTLRERIVEELETRGRVSPQSFDPLATACGAIYGAALEAGGVYLLSAPPGGGEEGFYCPLCELERHRLLAHPTAQDWIEGCCDAQLAYAREHALVPGVQ